MSLLNMDDVNDLMNFADAASKVTDKKTAPVTGDIPADITSFTDINETNLCHKAREFNGGDFKEEMPANWHRAVIIKNAIHNAIKYEDNNSRDIMEYMMTSYIRCGFTNPQQMKAMLQYDFFRVNRYLKDELRPGHRVITFPERRVVTINGVSRVVKPDAASACGKQIDLWIYRIGAPDVTQTGKTNAFKRDLQLYYLVQYARDLGYESITASYYFLKKKSDTNKYQSCDQYFFSGGGNIVSMSDIYQGHPNDLDKDMAPLVELLKNGVDAEQQSESACESCKYHDICEYELPPLHAVKDETAVPTAAQAKVKYSPAQEEAINTVDGIIRVMAGAGTGKTKTLVGRIIHLIKDLHVEPKNILVLTFMNVAAKEMKDRVAAELKGIDVSEMTICTFHKWMLNFLKRKEVYTEEGFKAIPKPIKQTDIYARIADILRKNPIPEWNGASFLNFQPTVGRYKGALQLAENVFTQIAEYEASHPGTKATTVDIEAPSHDMNDVVLMKLIALYDIYKNQLLEDGFVDFNGMCAYAFDYIRNHSQYLEDNFKYEHIMVDECQDTSPDQIEFLKTIKEIPTMKSLMFVGDDDQSIFAFRNTSPEYIINLDKYIGDTVKDVYLDDNYRCTPEILKISKDVVNLNTNKVTKTLNATRPSGKPVEVHCFWDEKEEIEYTAKNIKTMLDAGRRPEDFMVIRATKQELSKLADAFAKEGIPSMFGAPLPVMDNSRVKAILAFARVCTDANATMDKLKAANAIIGGKIMDLPKDKFDEVIENINARINAIRSDIPDAGKREIFMQYVNEIVLDDEMAINFIEDFEDRDFDEILDYCRNFELYGTLAEYRRVEEYPGVLLVTAHSSKGMERPVVFAGISKFTDGHESYKYLEEKRRLMFVAFTRARDELYITGQYYCGGTVKDGYIINNRLHEVVDLLGQGWNPVPPVKSKASTSKKTKDILKNVTKGATIAN